MQVFTTPGHEFRVASDRTATDGTFTMNVFGEIERFCVTRPLRFYYLDNGRNHFASFLDHHSVADPNVFAFNFILVVQCCARDCAAAHEHRLERPYRG